LFFFRAKICELFFAQCRPSHCVLAPKRALSASSTAFLGALELWSLIAAATRRLVVGPPLSLIAISAARLSCSTIERVRRLRLRPCLLCVVCVCGSQPKRSLGGVGSAYLVGRKITTSGISPTPARMILSVASVPGIPKVRRTRSTFEISFRGQSSIETMPRRSPSLTRCSAGPSSLTRFTTNATLAIVLAESNAETTLPPRPVLIFAITLHTVIHTHFAQPRACHLEVLETLLAFA